MTQERQNIWNVPNALTMIRALLIPVYWYLFMNGRIHWALAVFVIASLTDLADGYIARKYHLITDFGKLMDPLADKLMVISVMLSLALRGIVPWLPLMLLLAKEGVMVAGGALLYKRGIVVYSKAIGKAAQATVVSGLVLSFFREWLQERLGFPLHIAVIWLAVALTMCALFVYVRGALKTYREKRAEKQ